MQRPIAVAANAAAVGRELALCRAYGSQTPANTVVGNRCRLIPTCSAIVDSGQDLANRRNLRPIRTMCGSLIVVPWWKECGVGGPRLKMVPQNSVGTGRKGRGPRVGVRSLAILRIPFPPATTSSLFRSCPHIYGVTYDYRHTVPPRYKDGIRKGKNCRHNEYIDLTGYKLYESTYVPSSAESSS